MSIIANAQITIVDLSDPILSQTAPPTPTTNMLWLDTSVSPNVLKRWDGSKWVIVNDTSDLNNKIDNIEVGGRNYARKTSNDWTDWFVPNNKENVCWTWFFIYPPTGTKVGDTFTVSLDVEWEKFTFTKLGVYQIWFQGSVDGAWSVGNPFTSGGNKLLKALVTQDSGTKHLEWTITIGKEEHANCKKFEFGIRSDYSDGTGKIRIRRLKVERGNKATDWTPAPEDVDNSINNVVKKVETNTTDISTANGKISTLISNVSQVQTDIGVAKSDINTAKANITTLTNNYSTLNQTVSSLSSTVGSHTSSITTIQNGLKTTTDKIDNLSIGGRNLLVKTNQGKTKWVAPTDSSGKYTVEAVTWKGVDAVKITCVTKATSFAYVQFNGLLDNKDKLQAGKTYILSFDISDPSNTLYFNSLMCGDGTRTLVQTRTVLGNYKYLLVLKDSLSFDNQVVYFSHNLNAGESVIIANLKLEEGNKATDWTPAPEDTQTQITTISDKQSTFEQTLNGLTTQVSSLDSTVKTKADTSTVSALSSTVSSLQTNLDGFKTTVSNTYTTKADFNNLQVGGRNILRYSGNFTTLANLNGYWNDNGGGIAVDTSVKYLGQNTLKTTVGGGIQSQWYELDLNKTYTYSAMIMSDKADNGVYDRPLHFHCCTEKNYTSTSNKGVKVLSYKQVIDTANKWTLLYLTFKPLAQYWRAFVFRGPSVSNIFNIAYLKLEEGNKPTDWTPAPEDIDSNIASVDVKFKSYSTTTEMNSAISAAKDSITQSVSSTYTTKAEFSNLSVGGRNLLTNSSNLNGSSNINFSWYKLNSVTSHGYTSEGYHIVTPDSDQSRNNGSGLQLDFIKLGLTYGDICTFSCDIKGKIGSSSKGGYIAYMQSNNQHSNVYATIINITECFKDTIKTEEYTRISGTFTIKDKSTFYDSADYNSKINIQFLLGYDADVYVKNMKLERGNKPTDWTPAPKDVDASINTVATNLATANGNITSLTTRMQSAEQKLTKDGITTIVSDYYATKTEFDALSVGGRNLIRGTNTFDKDYHAGVGISIIDDGFNGCKAIVTQRAWTGYYINMKDIAQRVGLKDGDTVTLSIYVSTDSTTEVTAEGIRLYRARYTDKDRTGDFGSQKLKAGTWIRLAKTFVIPVVENLGNTARFESITDTSFKILWSAPQLERGNKATDWSYAPEDIDTTISSVSTNLQSQITQNADNINLKVSKNGVISAINQTAETVKIDASKIELTGKVTFSMFDSNAQTTINNASSNASTALSTANTASTNASSALTKANNAESNASSALSKANSATTVANNAQSAIDNLSIGGRNYIRYGKGDIKDGFFKNFHKVENGYGECTLSSSKTYKSINLADGFILRPRDYEVGKQVTMSYDFMYTQYDFPTGSNRQECWMGQRYTSGTGTTLADGNWRGVTYYVLPTIGKDGCELNKWIHISRTFTIPKQAKEGIGYEQSIQFYNSNADTTATITFRIKNVKIEYGNRATDWSPSYEEMYAGISEVDAKYAQWASANNSTLIDGGKIYTSSITAEKLAVDAIKSRNYVANTSGSFLNLKDGTFDSKYLKWDTEGKLSATGGTIGGLTINKDSISFSGKGKMFMSANIEGTTKFSFNTLDSGGFNTKILDWSFIDGKGNVYSSGYITPAYVVSQHLKGDFINANKILYAGDSTQAGQILLYSGNSSFSSLSYDSTNLKISTPVKATSFEATSESHFTKNGVAYKDPASGYNAAIKANGSVIISNNEGYYIGTNHLKITADSGDSYRVRISSNRGNSGGGIHLCCNYGVNVVNWDNNAFTLIRASAFNVSSLLEYKTNIKPLVNPFDIIQAGDIYTYNLKQDIKNGMTTDCYGFVIGEGYRVPSNVLSYDKKTIDQYAMSGILWGATKELIKRSNSHDDKIRELETENNKLKQQIATLEDKLNAFISCDFSIKNLTK